MNPYVLIDFLIKLYKQITCLYLFRNLQASDGLSIIGDREVCKRHTLLLDC